jgi:hypothetical protein
MWDWRRSPETPDNGLEGTTKPKVTGSGPVGRTARSCRQYPCSSRTFVGTLIRSRSERPADVSVHGAAAMSGGIQRAPWIDPSVDIAGGIASATATVCSTT